MKFGVQCSLGAVSEFTLECSNAVPALTVKTPQNPDSKAFNMVNVSKEEKKKL